MLPERIADRDAWREAFRREMEYIHGDCEYTESAAMLHRLVKSGVLRYTDLAEDPERFFEAHRMLLAPTRKSLSEGSGFGVRFTVQFNLFAGSVLGLGSPAQVAQLEAFQERGVLGCFNLTEVYAGVNSGLVVLTTATWSPEKQQFLIETPRGAAGDESGSEGAKKNWISQGLTASYTVVIANLCVGGKFYGPHGFLVQMRDEATGELLPGIAVEDMGRKTVANDLDNARVSFSGVWADKSALLSRFAEIRDDEYVQTTAERMRIEILGQRLLTGRLAIAQASVQFAQSLFANTKDYAMQKKCWAPKGFRQPALAEVPHIAAIFAEGEAQLAVLGRFNAAVEENLNKVLRANGIPDAAMVEEIAVSKIKSVQTAVTLTDKLGREVGSYALMHESGFGSCHWLYMCQFAEGDSRILLQKLARDSMKTFSKNPRAGGTTAEELEERRCCALLGKMLAGAKTPQDGARLWDENFVLVYQLAEAVCAKHVARLTDDRSRQTLFAPQTIGASL